MGEQYPSPDGQFILYLSCNEARMSHWVCRPDLVELSTGRKLYEAHYDIDASEIQWADDSRSVRFFLRVYPGTIPGKYVRLVIRSGAAVLEDA